VEIGRSGAVVDAHEIADDELSKRVDRPHRVQLLEAGVDCARSQAGTDPARGDHLQQQAVWADWR
jgi:hypothetical protein